MPIDIFLGAALLVQSHGAHVHGTYNLFAAVEGDQLAVNVSGPMYDILGFEHAPETEAEEAAISALKQKLMTENLVRLDPAAGCILKDSPKIIFPEGYEDPDHDEEGHDHDEDHAHDEAHDHGEDHAHDADHGDDEHDEGEGNHGDNADITYSFSCSDLSLLGSLTFTGFAQFPDIKEIEAVLLTSDQQIAAELTEDAPTLLVR